MENRIFFLRIVFCLFVIQHHITAEKGDSEEIDILWRKYGDLRADLEELKSKHRKDDTGSTLVASPHSGEKAVASKVSSGQQETKKDESGFIDIHPNLISASKELDPDGYWAYKVKMFPLSDLDFQCVLDNNIIPVIKDGKVRNKSFPTLEKKDGVLEITCFRKDDDGRNHVYLLAMTADGPAISIVFNAVGEGTHEFDGFGFQYKEFPSTISNELCQSKITLRWNSHMNVSRTNLDVDVSGSYINGSKPIAERVYLDKYSAFFPKTTNMNLTTKFLQEKKLVENVFSLTNHGLQDVQGTLQMGFTYSQFSSVVDSIYINVMLDNKDPCLPKIQKDKLALVPTGLYSLREGEIGSIHCVALGNPTPTIIMYTETANKKNILNTQIYVFKDTTSWAVKTWESTPSKIDGKIMCKAESGSKSVLMDIKFKIFSPYWISEGTKVTYRNGGNVTIQLQAKGPNQLHFSCFLNIRYGIPLFIEKTSSPQIDGYGVEQHNSTTNGQNSFSNELDERHPIITSYESNTQTFENLDTKFSNITIKTSQFTIDLSKAEKIPSKLFCSAFETPWDDQRDWIKIPLTLH